MSAAPRHTPGRPTWRCRQCGYPWPCRPAKTHLLTEYKYSPSALTIYLAAQMYDALTDLHRRDQPAALYDRFLSWARGTGAGSRRS
ncbi:hypothetical protein [Krasilnikovia sp. MM14-A1259]|uniref:hypothetical protein n=1 Tax=Krasilnikovia sp. MM14-A1259 TaxID=3373539 RepID=UPI003821C4A6